MIDKLIRLVVTRVQNGVGHTAPYGIPETVVASISFGVLWFLLGPIREGFAASDRHSTAMRKSLSCWEYVKWTVQGFIETWRQLPRWQRILVGGMYVSIFVCLVGDHFVGGTGFGLVGGSIFLGLILLILADPFALAVKRV